ncbi:hypothetical protein CkaCkLH20_00472 [Colletotrichum karsti]|uniref:Uncharacterized protein n=1 Tax=Colletotrichum karsti TaxID=1095194 RepID=A0A9P6LQY6_9PEZI|nr:uncharacterized protein CkaCkLH20_00472 [Colletotrichum karsti]KAF9882436.1 hypothetical protein CkaCkLH20_00472 [Colletotrichum karsti]
MDIEGKNEDNRDVRRLLWPNANPTIQRTEKEEDERNIASTASSSSENHAFNDIDQEHVTYCPETRRRILKPVSRKARAGISSAAEASNFSIPGKIHAANSFVEHSVEISGGGPATPRSSHVQPGGGESPRTAKALRLFNPANARHDPNGKYQSPGAGRKLNFEPSPKHYLALGMKGSSTTGSTIHSSEPEAVTPRKTGSSSEDACDMTIPARPHSVRTAPPVMSAANEEYFTHDPMVLDDSPSMRPLRRQMEGLSVGARPLSHPAEHPMGPRPFISTGSPPETPTKQRRQIKRARAEFDKTASLSGKDIAREREIMSHYAENADAMRDEVAEDMDYSEGDDDDDQETPKASILNRHLETSW